MTENAYPPIVVMGVSGSGKSTVGALLAAAIGQEFVDGDDLHPAANKEKMRAGHPLNDDDRAPWLDAIGRRLAEGVAAGRPVVVACSALKRSYRDAIRAHVNGLVFVHLDGSAELIRERMSSRQHEYMPSTLLDSQIATLEPLADDEAHVLVDLALPPEEILSSLPEAVSLVAQRA